MPVLACGVSEQAKEAFRRLAELAKPASRKCSFAFLDWAGGPQLQVLRVSQQASRHDGDWLRNAKPGAACHYGEPSAIGWAGHSVLSRERTE